MTYITKEVQEAKNEIVYLINNINLESSQVNMLIDSLNKAFELQKTTQFNALLDVIINDDKSNKMLKKLFKNAYALHKQNSSKNSGNAYANIVKNNPNAISNDELDNEIKEGYKALGISGNTNYIWSNYKQCIVELTAQNLTKAFLQNAIGFNYVDSIAMSFNKWGKKEYNIDILAQKIVEECIKKGSYSINDLSGSGIFRHPKDQSKLIINSNTLWSKDSENEERVFGKKVFENNIDLDIKRSDVEITQEQAIDFLNYVNTYNFVKKDDAILCAGWIASSALAGDSNHRPILNVTAPAGSGKSSFIHATKTFLGNFAIDYDGQATEAGIRQKVKNNSIVLLLDEAEATSEKLASTLTLLRGAYSGTSIIKGTSDQKGMQFIIKMQAMLVGIVPPALNAADASRIIRVEMTEKKDKNKDFFNKINRELGVIGKACIMYFINNYVKYKFVCKQVRENILFNIDNNRFADTYTTSIAASFVLNNIDFLNNIDELQIENDEELVCKIVDYVNKIDLQYYANMSKQSNDEEQFFEEILKTQLNDKELGNKSIIELINTIKYKKIIGDNLDSSKVADAVLQRTGLKFKDDALVIDTKSEALRRAIRNMKYKNADYLYLLKRVKNSQILSDRVVIGGTRVARSTAIKINIDFSVYNKEIEEDDVEVF